MSDANDNPSREPWEWHGDAPGAKVLLSADGWVVAEGSLDEVDVEGGSPLGVYVRLPADARLIAGAATTKRDLDEAVALLRRYRGACACGDGSFACTECQEARDLLSRCSHGSRTRA